MNGLRTAHLIATLLTGVAVGMLVHGWLRLPIAILCLTTLIQLASLEALRAGAATAARKVNR
jgi:hypothetical protein